MSDLVGDPEDRFSRDETLFKVKVCKDRELKQSGPQSSPKNPKREITTITNSQNTKGTYGQTSEQLFPKRWSLSNPNRTKYMNTHKAKRHRNYDTKNRQQRTTTDAKVVRVKLVDPHILSCVTFCGHLNHVSAK